MKILFIAFSNLNFFFFAKLNIYCTPKWTYAAIYSLKKEEIFSWKHKAHCLNSIREQFGQLEPILFVL